MLQESTARRWRRLTITAAGREDALKVLPYGLGGADELALRKAFGGVTGAAARGRRRHALERVSHPHSPVMRAGPKRALDAEQRREKDGDATRVDARLDEVPLDRV